MSYNSVDCYPSKYSLYSKVYWLLSKLELARGNDDEMLVV